MKILKSKLWCILLEIFWTFRFCLGFFGIDSFFRGLQDDHILHGRNDALSKSNEQELLSGHWPRILTYGPLEVQYKLFPIHSAVPICVDRLQCALCDVFASIEAKVGRHEAVVKWIELKVVISFGFLSKIPLIPHLPNFVDQFLTVSLVWNMCCNHVAHLGG